MFAQFSTHLVIVTGTYTFRFTANFHLIWITSRPDDFEHFRIPVHSFVFIVNHFRESSFVPSNHFSHPRKKNENKIYMGEISRGCLCR